MADVVRDALNELESALRARVIDLSAQIAPLQIEVVVLESELEKIAAARSAIGKVRELPANGIEAGKAAVAYWQDSAPSAPYRSLTMKQLIRTALADHFRQGATASEMVQLFHDKFERRDIVRSSLSPQLSRLKQDGELCLTGTIWTLATNASHTGSQVPLELSTDMETDHRSVANENAPPSELDGADTALTAQ